MPSSDEFSLPIIDLGPFTIDGYTESTKEDVLSEVRRANETLGCFYLKNHNIDNRLIKNAVADSRMFFAQSRDYKLQFAHPLFNDQSMEKQSIKNTSIDPRTFFTQSYEQKIEWGDSMRNADCGYIPFEKQNLNLFLGVNDSPNDPVEKYLLTPPRSNVDEVETKLWPDIPPSFKSNISEYYRKSKRLSEILMRVFSLAIDVPGYEDYFYDQCCLGESRLKIHFYPSNSEKKPRQHNRFPAHTDSPPFAVLLADGCGGGLQVYDKENLRWISADSKENMFIVNLGDSTARWTNDRWKAPVHRVGWPRFDEDNGRLSMVYFPYANADSTLGSIPGLVPEGEKPKYEPISYSQYVRTKVNAEGPSY